MVKRGSTGRATRVTLYDGGQILADLDSAGNRHAEYIYDAGTDVPYEMVYGGTTVTGVRFFAQDDLGNIQGQFSDSGAVTETVSYGDWGLPTITGGVTNRLTWKGLSYDPDVGLTYMRARWYDPNIGRFVSEDPAGLQGGINPYVFANNDPINGADPSGLCALAEEDSAPQCLDGVQIWGHRGGWLDLAAGGPGKNGLPNGEQQESKLTESGGGDGGTNSKPKSTAAPSVSHCVNCPGIAGDSQS